jgi:hypothetical protein
MNQDICLVSGEEPRGFRVISLAAGACVAPIHRNFPLRAHSCLRISAAVQETRSCVRPNIDECLAPRRKFDFDLGGRDNICLLPCLGEHSWIAYRGKMARRPTFSALNASHRFFPAFPPCLNKKYLPFTKPNVLSLFIMLFRDVSESHYLARDIAIFTTSTLSYTPRHRPLAIIRNFSQYLLFVHLFWLYQNTSVILQKIIHWRKNR